MLAELCPTFEGAFSLQHCRFLSFTFILLKCGREENKLSKNKGFWLNERVYTQLFSRILFPLVLNTMIVGATTLTNQVCCFKLHCLSHWRGTLVAGKPIEYCPWLAPPNLLVICRLSEWQRGSVQWFVPWEGSCLCHCYRQQLCYNFV